MSHYWSVACTLYHFSSFCSSLSLGELEWHSVEINHLPQMWPGFDSRTRRHAWAEFFVRSCPCAEGFSSGTLFPVLTTPPPQKTQQFHIPIRPGNGGRVDEEPLCGWATEILIYLLFIFIIPIQDLKIFKFVDLGSLHKRSFRTIMKLKLTYFSKRLSPSIIKIRVVYSSMHIKL